MIDSYSIHTKSLRQFFFETKQDLKRPCNVPNQLMVLTSQKLELVHHFEAVLVNSSQASMALKIWDHILNIKITRIGGKMQQIFNLLKTKSIFY